MGRSYKGIEITEGVAGSDSKATTQCRRMLECWNSKFTVFAHFLFPHYFRQIRYINSSNFVYVMQFAGLLPIAIPFVMNDF